MMRGTGLLLLALAIVEPAASQSATVTVDMDTVGCIEKGDTLQFVRLMASGDTVAASRFYTLKKPGCAIFHEGDVVEKWEEDTLKVRMTCVRPKGEPECRWLPTDLVKQ